MRLQITNIDYKGLILVYEYRNIRFYHIKGKVLSMLKLNKKAFQEIMV